MPASPYFLCLGRGNESEVKKYDAEGNPMKFPLFYDNYFVPRLCFRCHGHGGYGALYWLLR